MTTKRLVGLSIVCLIVLAIAVAGIVVYFHMNSGPKLRARANLAIKAGKLDKALSLAESYTAKNPDDWHGYYLQAKARSLQGNYALARPLLVKAASLRPTEPSIVLANAETYSLPAGRALFPAAADPNIQAIDIAVKDLTEAVRILLAFKPADDKAAISVNEAKGLDYRALFVAKSKLADRLEADAKVSEASRAAAAAQEKREAATAARSEADDYRRLAIQALLEVIRKDATRDTAAEPLVWLCLSIDDQRSLEEARKAIDAASPPPPMGAMRLAMGDVQRLSGRTGADFARTVDEASRRLDVLLAAYPDNNRLRQAQADLAMEKGDTAMACRLITKILESEPRNSIARLMLARVQLAENNCAEAERGLYSLTTEFPNFIQAHYYYAVAADATGKTELAKDQMRAVTKIDPGGSRETLVYHVLAHKYFARSLLATFPSQALDDAREAYSIDPNDTEAMLLLVESANKLNRPELARKTLEDALRRPATRPNMLLAVADGYVAIGEPKKADEILQLAATRQPKNYDDRLAVAQALIGTNRGSQADKLLNDAILEDPNNPRAYYVMAVRYDSTGRGLQAREHYRKAIQLDSRSPQYRLALANSLVRTGELDEALAVLEPVLHTSGLARQREQQIKVLQGSPAQGDWASHSSTKPASGLPMALACLQSGQAQQCANICQAELEKDRDNFDYSVLLARALLLQDKLDDSVKLFRKLIAAQPTQLPLYQFLALAMSRQAGPRIGAEELFKLLSAVPSARPDLVNVAVAEICRQSGRYADAAGFYDKAAQDPNCNEDLRYRARLFQVNSLANANQPDQALAVLDKVIANAKGVDVKTALANKINLLTSMRRLPQAEAAADELFRLARADHDTASLGRLAGNFAAIGKMDKALAACDAVQSLQPNQSGVYMLRAGILERFGKLDEAGLAYGKAVELNPTQFNNYVALANNFDARQKPVEALDTLRKLEGLGQAAKLLALYNEAGLFSRWGLRDQACERLKAIGEADIQSTNPAMQLELARAMVALDMVDSAKAILVGIPERAAQYVPARQTLADLAGTTEGKLAILHGLTGKNPGNEALLAQEMKILMDGGKPAEAVRAFEGFVSSGQARGRVSITSATGAIAAAIAAADMPSAMRTAKLLAGSTGPGQWKLLAATLAVEYDPKEASGLLPGRDQAQPAEAMLGLCLASKAGDANAAGQWLRRLDEIGFATTNAPAATGPEEADQFRLLCGILAGDDSRVKSAMDKLTASRELLSRFAKELAEHYLATTSAGPDAKLRAAEADKILRAEIAQSLLRRDLARLWFMEVLKARPTCQWAAARLMETAGTPDKLEEIDALLQPRECHLAQLLRARILSARGKYDQASKAYELLMAAEKPTAGLLFERAGAEENAGDLQKALDLYQQSLQAGGDAIIANNVAYLTAKLFSNDPKKLAEARELSEKAMTGSTLLALRDTAGWIAYLQGQTKDASMKGRNDDACMLLRQAVKALPASAEVHYHLGLAENAAKNRKLARMHLAQAAAIADKLRATKPGFRSTETEAGDRAKQALIEIEPD